MSTPKTQNLQSCLEKCHYFVSGFDTISLPYFSHARSMEIPTGEWCGKSNCCFQLLFLKYGAELEFPEGGGECKPNTSHWGRGGMDISRTRTLFDDVRLQKPVESSC